MEKEFVPYTEALALKELGFNEPCLAIYYSKDLSFSWHHHIDHTNDEPALESGEFNISAPIYSAAFRWFRDVHKLWAYQIPWSGNMYAMTIYRLIEDSETVKTIQDRVIMNTWEEAELACLKKLIEIVKK